MKLQQRKKHRFFAICLVAVFALTTLSLPVCASEDTHTPPQPLFESENKITPLPGDLLIGEDSGTAPHIVEPGVPFTLTGTIDVQPVKDQINRLKDWFVQAAKEEGYADGEKYLSLIEISELECTFETFLYLPDGLEFKTDSYDNAKFYDNSLFYAAATNYDKDPKKDLHIEMKLNNEAQYDNFETLWKAVNACPTLIVDAGNIVADAKFAGKELQATGIVKGHFTAKASFMGMDMTFPFDWESVQDPKGKDYHLPANDNKTISYTVTVKPAPEEERDILIPCPYPCQVPPMWNPQPQPSQVIQQVQPMPQAPVQNVDAAQAPIQLPKTGEKSTQPLSLFFLLSASALFLLRRKMR